MARGLVQQLIEALRCLPGVGPKSAQRMAFYLLERDREGGRSLGRLLIEAMDAVGHCGRCRTLTEDAVCDLCRNPRRDAGVLCIVETPAEMAAVEQATDFSGNYFVLNGRLSPLDGLGPGEIGLDELGVRLDSGEVREVILATNPTVEGDATAHYLADLAVRRGVRASRIAHGVPLGGELEYVDGGTLSHAFYGRRTVD